MAKTAGSYKGRAASIEAAMKAHGLGTAVIARALGIGRAFLFSGSSIRINATPPPLCVRSRKYRLAVSAIHILGRASFDFE